MWRTISLNYQRINHEEASGKVVKSIYSDSEYVVIAFEDGSFCYYECEYIEYKYENGIIERSSEDPPDYILNRIGLIDEDELNLRAEQATIEYRKQRKQQDYELYLQLKEEFEGQ